ncbi:MAG TPA: ABC transporter ATP-binding protein [Spirochaetia bacterium]|nr:ABC transporter ATP-binding protein [Spirochaetia bacterium]
MNRTVLEVKDLETYFSLDEGVLKAVDGVSFKVGSKETLGIIGESGCGKSVTAQSILRIVPLPGRTVSGQILFAAREGEPLDLVQLPPFGREIRAIRGKDITMIFQEPMTSLSPVHTIGNQIEETILLHKTQDKKEARALAIEMLAKVGIPNPAQRIFEYPHHLSGGLRQRVMIAMALSCNPALLVADEPTTALDVTVQAQILELIKDLQDQFGMSVLYITHDLGVIAEISDRVSVMYLGRVVESTSTGALFEKPMHPYTIRLLRSIPKVGRKARVRLDAIKGTVPIPLDPPRECGFTSRCPEAMAGVCDRDIPALVEMEQDHHVRCFLHSREKEPVHE